MALKLDMSKAFDIIEWVFVKTMLTSMGFLNNFVADGFLPSAYQ